MFANDTTIFLHNKGINKLFDAGNKVNQWLIVNRYQLMSVKLNTFYLELHKPN